MSAEYINGNHGTIACVTTTSEHTVELKVGPGNVVVLTLDGVLKLIGALEMTRLSVHR